MSYTTLFKYAYIHLGEEIELADHVANSVGATKYYSVHFYTPTSQVFLTLF